MTDTAAAPPAQTPETPQPAAEPVTTCGACGQADDHPKHTIVVGFNNPNTEGAMFHEHDGDRDGLIHYHFDCPTEWHGRVSPDVFDHHQRIVALASSGVHGDELRSRIVNGEV